MKKDENHIISSHNDSVISQFTKQAIPFAQMSQHSNQHELDLMLTLEKPHALVCMLPVALGLCPVSLQKQCPMLQELILPLQ